MCEPHLPLTSYSRGMRSHISLSRGDICSLKQLAERPASSRQLLRFRLALSGLPFQCPRVMGSARFIPHMKPQSVAIKPSAFSRRNPGREKTGTRPSKGPAPAPRGFPAALRWARMGRKRAQGRGKKTAAGSAAGAFHTVGTATPRETRRESVSDERGEGAP